MCLIAITTLKEEKRLTTHPKGNTLKFLLLLLLPGSLMASFVAENSVETTDKSGFRRSTTNNQNNPTNSTNVLKQKTKKFTSSSFRGFGCASAPQVSNSAVVIRTSADWEAKKVRKKKQMRSSHKKKNQQLIAAGNGNSVQDVWCAPGIGFTSSDATSDCVVVSRRPIQGRGRTTTDGERVNHRERPCPARRAASHRRISILDSPEDSETSRFASNVYAGIHHRHFRHRSPGGIPEILLFQSSLMMERRSAYDRHRDWRLDVDRMSYEELLELGERIGYVSTGLREEEILRCLRQTNHSLLDVMSSHFSSESDGKCSICQEEYETSDEMGKLKCGHSYHICCIRQWLLQKNTCPVCKVAAASPC